MEFGSKPMGKITQQLSAIVNLTLLGPASDEDRALGECLATAIGAYSIGQAQRHRDLVRAAANGQLVVRPNLNPSVN
jgi:hypothetical protein